MKRLATGLVLAVALTACNGNGNGDGTGGDGLSANARAHEGLCMAEVAARRGTVEEAERVFTDRAHAQLHVLAADVADADREVAARLLQAKQAVEAAFAAGAPFEQVTVDLDALAGATSEAIEAAGEPAPSPCRE